MNLRQLFVLLSVPLCTSGCVLAYKSLDKATDDRADGVWSANNCQITYAVKPSWINDWPSRRREDGDFISPPKINDYKTWADATIRDLGCKAAYADPNTQPDVVLEITEYPYVPGTATLERLLATLTLWVIPIPAQWEHRSYVFTSGESTRRIRVIEKVWIGWIFVPVFPLTLYYPYEEKIFKSQLRQYLSGK